MVNERTPVVDNRKCRRCDTKGPQVFKLVNGETTTDRTLALKLDWKWTSVSCSECGSVHSSVSRDENKKRTKKRGPVVKPLE